MLSARRSIALTLVALLHARAAVAQPDVAYACPFSYNVADSVAFIARQVMEVRNFTSSRALDLAFSNQFAARTRGLYSSRDMEIRNRVAVNGYFGTVVNLRYSLSEAKQACMERVNRFRRDGYDVYGVGSPIYTADDDETLIEHPFLSILEYPNYVPGTVAARAARGGLGDPQDVGSRNTKPSGGTSVNRWGRTPEQEREFRRALRERIARMKLSADSLWDGERYADAKIAYQRILFINDGSVDESEMRQRVQRADGLSNVVLYRDFTRNTGISFGVNGGSSYFERDGGLLGLGVARSTFGLNMFYGVGMALTSISDVVYDGSGDDRVGEYTKYQVRVGTNVPKLQLGSFGLRAGYIYQKTDKRALHLGLAGVRYGDADGLSMHADVIPVYGKLTYGFGIDMNFSK